MDTQVTRELPCLSWQASLYILSLSIALLSTGTLTGVSTNLKNRVLTNTL